MLRNYNSFDKMFVLRSEFDDYDLFEVYRLDGKFHRLDGPACLDGRGTKFYAINGTWIVRSEYDSHPMVQQYKKEQLLKLWKEP